MRVLILCTGNSARSQMAEGLLRQVLGDRVEVYSAGTQPAGYVHPLAIEAMQELGIDISHQRSKSVDEFQGQTFDLVITVCDEADRNCPVWLGRGNKMHVGFPDPAAATGSEEERLQVFREVRDGIAERVVRYVIEAYSATRPSKSERSRKFRAEESPWEEVAYDEKNVG